MVAREIVWSVSKDALTITPNAPQRGAVQGEHNVTKVVFNIPDDCVLLGDDLKLYIGCTDSTGGYDKTEPLTVKNGRVEWLLPRAWTQYGGTDVLELTAEKADQIVYSVKARVVFESRPGTKKGEKKLLEGFMQAACDAAAESAERAAASEQAAAGHASASAQNKSLTEQAARFAEERAASAAAASSVASGAANHASEFAGRAAEDQTAATASATRAEASAAAAEQHAKTVSDGIEFAQNAANTAAAAATKAKASEEAADNAMQAAAEMAEDAAGDAAVANKAAKTAESNATAALQAAEAAGTSAKEAQQAEADATAAAQEAAQAVVDAEAVTQQVRADMDVLNQGGLLLKDAYIAQQVDRWLTDHPEATVAVQDHSLTMDKMVIGTLGYVTPQMYGAKGDGVTDDTAAINACLAENDNVYLPDGVYMIDATVSVKPKIGQTLVLADNAVLKCIPTAATNFDVIKIENVADVTIKGGKIVGEKDEHLVTTGEFGYGIAIYNSQRVTIDGCEIYNHWGDAVCIISKNINDKAYEEYACRDIVVKNAYLHKCRRQGISVVGCIGFLADNVDIQGIAGTAPQSGIDFEAGIDKHWNDGCEVRNTTIKDCVAGIFANSRTRNVIIDGCTILNNSTFRQSETIEIRNSKLHRFGVGGNVSRVLHSTMNTLVVDTNTKKVIAEHCTLWGGDDGLLFCSLIQDGTASEAVIDFDHCVFHTIDSDVYSNTMPNSIMNVRPKKIAIKNSTFFINNPNGTRLQTTEAFDLINNTFVVDYSSTGSSTVLMTVAGECNIVGNTFKKINASAAGSNDSSLFQAHGANVTFINNRYIGNDKIGPYVILHKNQGGSVTAINNVFRAYSNLGWIGTDVAVTEIGNVYSTTT